MKRVTPIAGWSIVVVFALIGAALVAAVWTTRSTVLEASGAVRRGERAAIAAKVRDELRDLRGDVAQSDLEEIYGQYRDEGLRYIAMYDAAQKQVLAYAGAPADTSDVMQVDLKPRGRRRRQLSGDEHKFMIEVAPEAANALAASANRTLWVGGLAAAALLGVAIVMILRESQRRRDEREAEHARRLASLGEMSAVLAHEIKNPLASLKGNAQLLAAMLPPDEKPRRKADRIVDEAMRLEQLTIDLLQFVRTGAIERTAVDPIAIVTDAVGGRAPLELDRAPRSWKLDAGRFREVVANLVDNALAAAGEGKVAVRLDQRGREMVLEVADRGPGVPEDQRDKIFEPFVTGKTRGTGLGLAVTRRIVELHGGTIEVLSNPGGGALFRVAIPEGQRA